MKELQKLNHYFLRYKKHLIGGILITILANFLATKIPPVVRNSLNVVSDYLAQPNSISINQVKEQLIVNVLLILALSFVAAIFGFFKRQILLTMSRLIEYDLRNDIYTHYQELSLSFYRKNRVGDLMNRITEDVNKVRMYFGQSIMFSINMIVVFVIVFINMLKVDVVLTLYALIPLPILSLSIYSLSKTINRKSRVVQEQLSALTTFTQEVFSGVRVLKAYVLEDNLEKEFTEQANLCQQKNVELYTSQAFFFPLIIFLIGVSNILVIYFGGVRYINGQITFGVIAEFILYVNMLTWPVTTLGWVTAIIQQAEASQKRINSFFNEKSEVVNRKNTPVDLKGSIVFDKVYFKYQTNKNWALENVSLNIKSGQTIGILGKTGAGKSSIISLIARQYNISKGQILIDGSNIEDIDLKSLREQAAVVPQDAFLFSDTIENNLRIGNDTCSLDEIIEVCKKVSLHETIIKFSKKYQTFIGERGVTLSGGQKQRVALARAWLKKPKVLILDDCLSALDTYTESEVIHNLKLDKSLKTVIIITHRVSSVKHADKIIVLEKGQIVQAGIHSQLIKNKGFYKQLYQKQIDL